VVENPVTDFGEFSKTGLLATKTRRHQEKRPDFKGSTWCLGGKFAFLRFCLV
jgi:hypothetical protein